MNSITGLCDAFEINKKRPSTAIANPELSLTPGTSEPQAQSSGLKSLSLGHKTIPLRRGNSVPLLSLEELDRLGPIQFGSLDFPALSRGMQ